MKNYIRQPFSLQYGGAVFRGNKYQFGAGGQHVFRGMKYQYGNGLGDILRGIGRFLFPILAPIASRAASSFITNASDNLASGKTLKEAALGSLKPMLSDTIEQAKDTISKRMQSGCGHGFSKPKYVRLTDEPVNASMAAANFIQNLSERGVQHRPKRKAPKYGKSKDEKEKLLSGRGRLRSNGVYKRKRNKSKSTHSSKRFKHTNF